MSELTPGLSAELEHIVTDDDTAANDSSRVPLDHGRGSDRRVISYDRLLPDENIMSALEAVPDGDITVDNSP